jgi:hypothetical protein
MIKFLQDLTQETVVDIKATIAAAEVRSCTQATVELQIQRSVAAHICMYPVLHTCRLWLFPRFLDTHRLLWNCISTSA